MNIIVNSLSFDRLEVELPLLGQCSLLTHISKVKAGVLIGRLEADVNWLLED